MRSVSGMILAAMVFAVMGCGDSKPTPAPEPNVPLAPNPADPKTPTDSAASTGWEMDPAKHVIPNTPVAGKLGGKAFTPEAQVQGETLRFRVLNPLGSAEQEIDITFREPGKPAVDRKIVVNPSQPASPELPVIAVSEIGKATIPLIESGYALTLELGKRENGKVAGKIALSLPGEEKSYLQGTFTAEWVRGRDELPGAEDAPLVQGKLIVAGNPPTADIRIGYVRVDPYEPTATPILDLLGIQVRPAESATRGELNRPRVTVIVPPGTNFQPPGRYELLHLEPGRYWVFAALQGGPIDWAWVTVDPKGMPNADLTLDPTKTGGVEVTIPPGPEMVSVVPAAEPGKPWPESLVLTAASMIDLQAKLPSKPDGKDAQVTFPRLRPGKYEAWAGDYTGTIEVKAGETAKLTLTKKK